MMDKVSRSNVTEDIQRGAVMSVGVTMSRIIWHVLFTVNMNTQTINFIFRIFYPGINVLSTCMRTCFGPT